MDNNTKLNKRFAEIEKRLRKLEEAIFTYKLPEKKKGSQYYKGATGGIRLLIDDGFFKTPKSVKEIILELKREGYHYPDTSIFKILSVDFTNREKTLNRIREGRIFKYVIRK